MRGKQWLRHGGQLTSRFQCSRDRLVWPVRQVLAQEELRLVATPRRRTIRTLDFPEQNQPGAVARGTGREGKTEEASHGVGVGEQLWEPTSCTSWPSPTPALCLLVWGRGTEDSSHSLMGTPPWPGCLQLLQGAPSRWLCLQRCCGELDQSQRPVWAVLEPGWWFFVVVVFVFLFVCFLTGSSEKQR